MNDAPPPAASDAPAVPARTGLRPLLGALLLALLGLALYAPKAVDESFNADFERYYHAGAVALSGGDIYDAQQDRKFKYFPFFAQIMMPVAWFGETVAGDGPTVSSPDARRAAAYLWYAILCASYLGSVALATAMTRPATPRRALGIACVAIAFSARFFVANIRNGQINMPVMFLAVLGCWLLLTRRECLSGIAVGLGAVIKFMPVVLTLWAVRQRRWWMPVYLASMLLAALILLPAVTWGPERNIAMLEGYVGRRHKMVTDLPDNQAAGQSVASMANRLLRKVNAASLRREDKKGNRQPIYIHVMDSPAIAKYATTAIVIALVVLSLALLGKLPAARSRRGALEAGLLFLLMLLISPEARKAHFVTVLVPAAALAAVHFEIGLSRTRVALAALAFACLSLSSSGLLGEGDLYDYLNAYGVIFWGAVLFFSLTAGELRRARDLPPEPADDEDPEDAADPDTDASCANA